MTRPASGAPDFMTSPGLSGYCLTGAHLGACRYRACVCACHEKETR